MPERLINFLSGIPFLIITVVSGKKNVRVNWARIIEAVIIALITGMVAGFVSVKQLEVKMEDMTKRVDQVDQRLYEHMEKKNDYTSRHFQNQVK